MGQPLVFHIKVVEVPEWRWEYHQFDRGKVFVINMVGTPTGKTIAEAIPDNAVAMEVVKAWLSGYRQRNRELGKQELEDTKPKFLI